MEKTSLESKSYQEFESKFNILLCEAGNLLSVDFQQSSQMREAREFLSESRKMGKHVNLVLRQPHNNEQMKAMFDAVATARIQVLEVKQQMKWEESNPNAFEALIAKYHHRKFNETQF